MSDLIADELIRMNAEGVIIGGDPDSAWQIDDRKWFDDRPTRGYRLRRAHQGEPAFDGVTWALVKRINEDARSKLPVYWQGEHGRVDMLAQLARLSDIPSQDGYYDIVLGLMYEGIVKRRYQPLATILIQADALYSWAPVTCQ